MDIRRARLCPGSCVRGPVPPLYLCNTLSRYGACVASPWPHASFEPDSSYSQLGAAIVTGGITLNSSFVAALPLTVFPYDSPTALASAGTPSPAKAVPKSRAFSACSLIGISDYFIMCVLSSINDIL